MTILGIWVLIISLYFRSLRQTLRNKRNKRDKIVLRTTPKVLRLTCSNDPQPIPPSERWTLKSRQQAYCLALARLDSACIARNETRIVGQNKSS